MIPITKFQHENLTYAANVMWPAIQPEQVAPGLYDFRKKTACGTVACFGGHVAMDPWFQERGVSASRNGVPVFFGTLCNEQRFFGVRNLFAPRRFFSPKNAAGEYIAPVDETNLTDHEAITARLKWALENTEVV